MAAGLDSVVHHNSTILHHCSCFEQSGAEAHLDSRGLEDLKELCIVLDNLLGHAFGCITDAERPSSQDCDRIRPQPRQLSRYVLVLHCGGELVAVRPRHAIRNVAHFQRAEMRVHAAAIRQHRGQCCTCCGCYVYCVLGRIAQVQQQDQASNQAGIGV